MEKMACRLPDSFVPDSALKWGCKFCVLPEGHPQIKLINPAAYEDHDGHVLLEAECPVCHKRQKLDWDTLR
jgi:hypothetical protein